MNIPFYLDPKLARENLQAARLHRVAMRIRRARLAQTEQAFRSLGWDAKACAELARFHVAEVA